MTNTCSQIIFRVVFQILPTLYYNNQLELMFNPNKNNIAPILWVDSTSRDDSSKRMLNFMKKTFEVFPVISIEEAENILTKEKRQFNLICSNYMAPDVSQKLMKLNQVKNICIFCNYLKKGEENVQTFGGKFAFAKNHLNAILDFFAKPETQKEEARQLDLFNDETYGKLLFHIGRMYMDANLNEDGENYLNAAIKVTQIPALRSQIQQRLQRIRDLR